MGEPLWSLLGVLAAVVGILWLAYVSTRWIASRGAAPLTGLGGAEGLRVLAQLPLGRGERLVVAEVGEHCCLLGVTEHQITLLRELEEGEADRWRTAADAAPGFREALMETLRKRK